jgi:hypothetical protein
MKALNSSSLPSDYNSRNAFTALIAAFIFHNIEEAIFICRFPVQSPVSFIEPATCRQFLWAVSIITLIVLVLYIAAVYTKKPMVYHLISTAIASALVLNVLVPHIAVAVYSLNYTPGLLTAVLLNLPLGLFTLFKNRSLCTDRKQFYRFIGIGLVVGYLIFAVVMVLVSSLVGK